MQLIPTLVSHARVRPRRNAFRYGLCYFAIPLRDWSPGTRARFFSIDRFNLFSLRSGDYGDGRPAPAEWVAGILDAHCLTEADGEIVLVTLPRLLGYAFNPVSFWFCFDRAHGLRAVLAEVNNTFGERHCYLCCRDDHAPITKDARLSLRKIFHVSPFLEVKGTYRFGFEFNTERVGIQIDLLDEDGLCLATAMNGRPKAMTAGGLLKTALSYPLQTLQVVALIHYQAAKLFLKGVRNHRKPVPPETLVSQ
jgi:uncharacterized protein